MSKRERFQIQPLLTDFRQFKKEYKNLAWWLGFFIALAYGIRILHDNIFLDSEIMILRPDFMRQVWIGSSRFGLAFTSYLFGMSRLVPYVSAFLAAILMWVFGMALSFGAYLWCGKSCGYRRFLFLFPALAVTCPVFAGQYLFILQAFEITFAIVLCTLAAICTGRFVYQNERGWLIAGVPFMVWAFGSYQSMVSLYICLVLLSFLLTYMNGKMEHPFSMGVRHLIVFFAGIALYGILSAFIKQVLGIESEYVSELVHWPTDGWRACVSWIRLELVKILGAKEVFYSRLYLPSMCLFTIQAMWYGWKKKRSFSHYMCFLLAGGLFLVSPFFITLILGFTQPVRSQLVYPVTFACFLAHLTVIPEGVGLKENKKRIWSFYGTRFGMVFLTGVSVFALSRNTMTTAQLFQSAWEAYRNDVMTANRMYEDICHAADREDMENCLVVFVGGRDAGLTGPAVKGELSGYSFFEAEAHTATGVSGRAGSLFLILGLKIQVLTNEQADIYHQAVEFMKEAPGWPAQGSVGKMGEVVVVKLSDTME